MSKPPMGPRVGRVAVMPTPPLNPVTEVILRLDEIARLVKVLADQIVELTGRVSKLEQAAKAAAPPTTRPASQQRPIRGKFVL
jgi:hypothetical protein